MLVSSLWLAHSSPSNVHFIECPELEGSHNHSSLPGKDFLPYPELGDDNTISYHDHK